MCSQNEYEANKDTISHPAVVIKAINTTVAGPAVFAVFFHLKIELYYRNTKSM